MIERRVLLGALAAAPIAARAQTRTARIGFVGSWYSEEAGTSLFDAFRQGMRDHGWVEGQNLVILSRWLAGVASPREEAGRVTIEFVRAKVDVLVAQGTTIDGAKAESGSIPVVFVYSGDPVEAKFVQSLSRPGGNSTGLTVFDVELGGKQLQLLQEAVPGIAKVGVIANPLHLGEYPELERTQGVARRLNIEIRHALVRTPAEIDGALDAFERERVQALMIFPNLLTLGQRHAISEFSARHRIPTISGWRDFAIDGTLITYGPDLWDAWRHVATYVDRILKGAKPADLPVEQPTRFQLVINLKVASALGLTLSPTLLARADHLIE